MNRSLLTRLARLYPESWRSRYGDEFNAMLETLAPVKAWHVWDVFRNLAAVWAATLWASSYGPMLAVALPFFCAGLGNAVWAMQGGTAVWFSTSVFFLVALALAPAAAFGGFLAAGRSGRALDGARTGVGVMLAGLVLHCALLALISSYFASQADPFPAERYAGFSALSSDPVRVQQLRTDVENSRDWFLHWRRATLWSFAVALPVGAVFGWVGGLLTWMRRTRRSHGRLR